MQTGIDFETIDFLKGLDPESWETFRQLVESFSRKTPIRIERMQNALKTKESKIICEEAHQLVSICGNLGAVRLSEMAAKLDKLAKENSFEEIKQALSKFEIHYLEVNAVLTSSSIKS